MSAAALRIDHIGSTSVSGLDAKPIIDIQVAVASLDPLESYRAAIEESGFVWRDNPDKIKRLFCERPGERRTNIHVVAHGTFIEQFHLLFRDYLRSHPSRSEEYAKLKRELSPLYVRQMAGVRTADGRMAQPYTDAKAPFIWETLRLAYEWSFDEGWNPGPSDA